MTEPEKEIITELGLKELIKIYDGELERQKNLDTKAASLLGFTSIVVTILLFNIKYFLDNPITMSKFYSWIIISVLILALSLILLIFSILVRNYKKPVQPDRGDDLHEYVTNSKNRLQKDILFRYIDCIPINYQNNEEKARALKYGTVLLVIGVLTALASPVIIFLTVYWGL